VRGWCRSRAGTRGALRRVFSMPAPTRPGSRGPPLASAVGHRCWHRKGNRLDDVHIMDALGCWPVERRQTGRQEKRADESDQKDNKPFDAALLHRLHIRLPHRLRCSRFSAPWLRRDLPWGLGGASVQVTRSSTHKVGSARPEILDKGVTADHRQEQTGEPNHDQIQRLNCYPQRQCRYHAAFYSLRHKPHDGQQVE